MISLDTNVWVRILTRDDPDQASAAMERISTEPVFLPKTVLLELEWVLRHSYRLSREVIAHTFRSVLSLERLEVEDRPAVLQACAWHDQGMDFADALHLASSASASRLLTFDRRFANTAESAHSRPVVEVLPSRPT